MASRQSTIDYILEQISSAGAVSARKMFGEYGIYCDGKIVALVCDNQLFVKPTTAGRGFVGTCNDVSPYPGAKPCLLISGGAGIGAWYSVGHSAPVLFVGSF